jgi:UDPglucose 6-dehydrogenase
MSVNIIGYGFVGSSIGHLCEMSNTKYKIYDTQPKDSNGKYECYGSVADLVSNSEKSNTDNFYFISVPTPSDEHGNCDTSIVDNVLEKLSACCNHSSTYVIIKSTIVPGTCKRLFEKYSQLNITFCPEFLRELTCKDDIYNANFVLCSSSNQTTQEKISKLFSSLYKHNPNIEIIFKSKEECELFKYTLNVHFAMKVWYFNEIYELCEKLDVDYQSLKTLFKLDQRIGDYGTTVPGDDGFGFSKSCLPKEIKGMMKLQENLGIPNEVFKDVIKRNNYFRTK